jgi:hypothetical protein
MGADNQRGHDDQALLRRFEPILRFTRGERFFPMDTAPYLRESSLWELRPGTEAVRVVPRGGLSLDSLPQPRVSDSGSIVYLKLTDPLTPAEMAARYLAHVHADEGEYGEFKAGLGRLARVGYFSRVADALFSISLLTRGRVPGDAAEAATEVYRRMRADGARFRYHGRVVRQSGWIVLQYWFFYAFNDWRSRFFGANDHEADWETVSLYLSESEDGDVTPEWAAYAAHNESGDDLRRRWDDPELEKEGEHPIVYIGAGSHASYFRRGEYVTEIELPFLAPLARVADRAREFWHETLRQYAGNGRPGHGNGSNLFRIPFVDYARGDGLAVGPGTALPWDAPRLLSPPPAWATSYRGRWGLYARDPFQAENAPAGPVYNHDGTVRHVWYDPVGWAGLDKVPPCRLALPIARQRREEAAARQTAAAAVIEQRSRELQRLGVEDAALQRLPQSGATHLAHQQTVDVLAKDLAQLQAQAASDQTLIESLDQYVEHLRAGYCEPARAHIRRPREPVSEAELRFSRAAETWAAVSVGLMLIAFIAVLLLAQQHLLTWLVAVIPLLLAIDAVFRHRLTVTINNATIALTVVAALVIAYEFFWLIGVLLVLAAGFYLLWDNLRELRT